MTIISSISISISICLFLVILHSILTTSVSLKHQYVRTSKVDDVLSRVDTFAEKSKAIVVDNTDDLVTLVSGSFKLEAKRILSDGVYNFGNRDSEKPTVTPPTDENNPTEKEGDTFAPYIQTYNKAHLRPFSFNIRISDTRSSQILFTYAEGRRDDDFLKTKSGSASAISVAQMNEFVEAFSNSSHKISDENVKSIVQTLPTLFKQFYQEINKATARKASSLIEINTGVDVLTYRYYVAIYTGPAFYIGWPGQHSASIIYRVNDANNMILRIDYNGNHGRLHNATGISFKCMHRGAATILATAAQPPNWDCSTPYWALWCVRGPNHNCNANAQHHMEISDNPSAPPSSNTGICARFCPIRSPSC